MKLIDAKSQRYASMLRTAAKREPNFAGHYILASWGGITRDGSGNRCQDWLSHLAPFYRLLLEYTDH